MQPTPGTALVLAASDSLGSEFGEEVVILCLRDGTYYSLKDAGSLIRKTVQQPVRTAMTDLYLWYQAIPNINPTSFDSPEACLEVIRYRPLDSTCPAADDLDHQFGDPAEASLQEAFVFMTSGACSPRPTDAAGQLRARSPGRSRIAGWQSVGGAH